MGAVITPERAGAILLLVASWADGRRQVASVEQDADERLRLVYARSVAADRRADAAEAREADRDARVAYLERQVKRLSQQAPATRGRRFVEADDDSLVFMGPTWDPPQGTLLRSVGGFFKRLLGG